MPARKGGGKGKRPDPGQKEFNFSSRKNRLDANSLALLGRSRGEPDRLCRHVKVKQAITSLRDKARAVLAEGKNPAYLMVTPEERAAFDIWRKRLLAPAADTRTTHGVIAEYGEFRRLVTKYRMEEKS